MQNLTDQLFVHAPVLVSNAASSPLRAPPPGLSLLSALEITKDAPVSVGPFQHTLEYTQMLPGVAVCRSVKSIRPSSRETGCQKNKLVWPKCRCFNFCSSNIEPPVVLFFGSF